jgi:hypothetical protein
VRKIGGERLVRQSVLHFQIGVPEIQLWLASRKMSGITLGEKCAQATFAALRRKLPAESLVHGRQADAA